MSPSARSVLLTVDKHAHTAVVAGKGSVYVENKGTFGGGTNDLPLSISFADASGRAFAKCRDMLGGELDSRHEIYVNGTGSYENFRTATRRTNFPPR